MDSWSNYPSGILKGNLIGLGYFDECIETEHQVSGTDTIFGKYCIDKVPIRYGPNKLTKQDIRPDVIYNNFGKENTENNENFNLTLAFCIPNACTLQEFLLNLPENQTRFPFRASSIVSRNLPFLADRCQTKLDSPVINAGDWTAFSYLIILTAIIIASTFYDCVLACRGEEPKHKSFIAFSWLTNGKKLIKLKGNANQDQLSCINGIRVLSMLWIIYAHRFFMNSSSVVLNATDGLEWSKNWRIQYILNANVAVDTFLVLSGILLSYIFMNTIAKGTRFNLFQYYLHRYLRLTPPLIVMMTVHIFVLKHLGSGPFWPAISDSLVKYCEKHWWINLLYVQNYLHNTEICIFQTWYIALDMQLYILSPIILFALIKWPKKGLLLVGSLMSASIASCFAISWFYELPVLDLSDRNYNTLYYYTTHTRASSWLVGVLTGYFIHKLKYAKLTLALLAQALGWIVSVTVLLAVLFGIENFKHHDYYKFETSIYLAFSRFAWSVAISWIIFSCVNGSGGPVNYFLSLPVFEVMSRLTYCMYLVHLTLQFFIVGNTRVPIYFSELRTIYQFGGDMLYILFYATVLSLSAEAPVLTLEKILLKKK